MTRRYAIILLTVLLSILTAGAVNVSPRIFRNYTAANGLADNGAQTILCTKTGRLVITTAGQINFYDGASFSYIDPLDENIYALSDYRGNYHLYFDKYHHIDFDRIVNPKAIKLCSCDVLSQGIFQIKRIFIRLART